MIPFVEEKYEGAFNNLYRDCHLHIVDKGYFDKLSWYKYTTRVTHDIPILSYRYIPNIYKAKKKLKLMNNYSSLSAIIKTINLLKKDYEKIN